MLRSLASSDTRDKIVRRLDQLAPSTPARWGIMSCPQMLHHLTMAFRMTLSEYPVAAIPNHRFNSDLWRFLALNLPAPWPRGITAPKELDCAAAYPSDSDFARDRTDLRVLIYRFSETPFELLNSTHPMMGSLTHSQLMRWGYRHTDHHLRQFGC